MHAQDAIDRGEFSSATAVWAAQQAAVGNATDNVDWYNALLHNADDDDSSAAASWLQHSPGECASMHTHMHVRLHAHD